MKTKAIYVGLKGHVAAISQNDGATLWKTKLKGGLTTGESFVTLLVDEPRVYAHTFGELFCLDATTGSILWKNELGGLGYGIASLAVDALSSLPPEALAHIRAQSSRNQNYTS